MRDGREMDLSLCFGTEFRRLGFRIARPVESLELSGHGGRRHGGGGGIRQPGFRFPVFHLPERDMYRRDSDLNNCDT